MLLIVRLKRRYTCFTVNVQEEWTQVRVFESSCLPESSGPALEIGEAGFRLLFF